MTASRRVVAWAAFLAWAAVVWFLSSRPDPAEDLAFPWRIPDKLAHGIEFAVGGALGREAFGGLRSPFLAAVVACAVWGFADEVHQGFVPGRETDPLDLAADVTGAAVGALIHHFVREGVSARARGSG